MTAALLLLFCGSCVGHWTDIRDNLFYDLETGCIIMFADDPPPPTSIDPDSIAGRLTLVEERLKTMSTELDSLKAMSIRHGSLKATSTELDSLKATPTGHGSLGTRTGRRRRRARQRNIETAVKLGLATALMFVLALFLLYEELEPPPHVAWAPSHAALAPSPMAVPPTGPRDSDTAEPDAH